MKTLSKIKINPERILKDEELRTLNGGGCWYCIVTCPTTQFGGEGCGPTHEYVQYTCEQMWGPAGCSCWC
jgi:natural product precursor